MPNVFENENHDLSPRPLLWRSNRNQWDHPYRRRGSKASYPLCLRPFHFSPALSASSAEFTCTDHRNHPRVLKMLSNLINYDLLVLWWFLKVFHPENHKIFFFKFQLLKIWAFLQVLAKNMITKVKTCFAFFSKVFFMFICLTVCVSSQLDRSKIERLKYWFPAQLRRSDGAQNRLNALEKK